MYFFDSLWYAWWFLWHFCPRTFWYSELFQRGWSPSLDMYLVRWLVGTGLWWYVVAVMAAQFWPHLVVQMGVEEQLTQNWCRLIQMCEETIVFKAYTWRPVVSGWCKILLRSEPLAKLQLAKRVKSQWCEPNNTGRIQTDMRTEIGDFMTICGISIELCLHASSTLMSCICCYLYINKFNNIFVSETNYSCLF